MNKTNKFNQIFTLTLTTNLKIEANEMVLPKGVIINEGVKFGGVDFTEYIGCDIAVYEENGIITIKGVYAEKQKGINGDI